MDQRPSSGQLPKVGHSETHGHIHLGQTWEQTRRHFFSGVDAKNSSALIFGIFIASYKMGASDASSQSSFPDQETRKLPFYVCTHTRTRAHIQKSLEGFREATRPAPPPPTHTNDQDGEQLAVDFREWWHGWSVDYMVENGRLQSVRAQGPPITKCTTLVLLK